MAKSQARRAQRAKDVVPHDLEDEEALHEGEDEAGISQKGLDRLMRALGPDSLGDMDMALLEQLRNEEDEEQDEDEDENDDEDEDDEEEENVENLIDDEAEDDVDEQEEEEEEDDDDEDVEDLIDDEAEEEDADDDEEDEDDDDEDVEDLIDDEAEEEDVDDEEEEDSEGRIDDESKEEEDENSVEIDNKDGKNASSSAPKDSLAASILRSGLVPDEDDDDDDDDPERQAAQQAALDERAEADVEQELAMLMADTGGPSAAPSGMALEQTRSMLARAHVPRRRLEANDQHMVFSLVSRKQTQDIHVPTDASISMHARQQQAEAEAERQQLKAYVLAYREREES